MVKAQKPQRTNHVLWEVCKKEAVEKAGKFSARCAACHHYKKDSGGSYLGQKSAHNALVKWDEKQNTESKKEKRF